MLHKLTAYRDPTSKDIVYNMGKDFQFCSSEKDLAPVNSPSGHISTSGSDLSSRIELSGVADTGSHVWCGRIVDGETHKLLPNARYDLTYAASVLDNLKEGEHPVATDATVDVRVARYQCPIVVVSCPDYSTAFVVPKPGHEERANAQLVPLWQAAAVHVCIKDVRLIGTESLNVCIVARDQDLFETSFGSNVTWHADQAGSSEFDFAGLPPLIPLQLEIRDEEGLLTYRRFTLDPGEVREISFNMYESCTITGLATTPDKAPLEGLEIWLVSQPKASRYLHPFEEVCDRAYTNERGEFAFNKVPPGEWFVGPAPSINNCSKVGDSAGHLEFIAPVAAAVTVEITDRVPLICWSGFRIIGKVVAEAGHAARNALVVIQAPNILLSAQADSNGVFATGPLIPGAYTLFAEALGSHSRSASKQAFAGDEGVELHLRPGGSLVVTVQDEHGKPANSAYVRLMSVDGLREGWGSGTTNVNGSITFNSVPVGSYAVIATRDDSISVWTNVSIERGASMCAALYLQRGVRLKIVRPQVDSETGYRIKYEGWTLEALPSNTQLDSMTVLVPAGMIEIELVKRTKNRDVVVEVQAVSLQQAESAEVAFGAPTSRAAAR